MINLDTVRFIDVLNELAAKTKNGYVPFSKATKEDTGNAIVYDDSKPNKDSDKYPPSYPVVWNSQIDSEHHDIIDYMSDRFPGEKIRIYAQHEADSDDFYLDIDVYDNLNRYIEIIVADGNWTVA